MRIYDKGDYAYELEQSIDPMTQLRQGWTFRVYRVRPVEQVVEKGEAASKDEAEKQAKRAITTIVRRSAA